jgi:hypothetical protein
MRREDLKRLNKKIKKEMKKVPWKYEMMKMINGTGARREAPRPRAHNTVSILRPRPVRNPLIFS